MNVAEYARMYEAEERQWWYAGMRAVSLALLAGPLARLPRAGRAPLILDAGCGTGNNLLHLARFGRPVGVDLSEDALRFCRSRGVTVARAELLALPFPADRFDCVTSLAGWASARASWDRSCPGRSAPTSASPAACIPGATC